MPIGFFAALFSALGTIGSTTVAGISVATIAKFVIGVGLSLWSSAKQSTVTNKGQSVLNQSDGDRLRGYGLCLLGGTRAYFEAHNRELWQVIVMHHGRVNKIRRVLIAGTKVDIDNNNQVTTEPWKRGSNRYYVNVWSRLGFDSQSAYQDLIDVSEGAWTAKHRLQGLATLLVKFDHARADRYQSLYPRGSDTSLQAIVETSRVYDPRTGETVYSANSALVIRDHLVSSDGFAGITERDIDEESFAAFADVCEGKYEAHGLYSLLEPSKDVHARLAATCDARLYITPKGLIGIRGGKWQRPRFTIRDEHILDFDFKEGTSGAIGFNRLHTFYTDPKQNFQRTEAPIWNDYEDQSRNGVRASDLPLDMVADANQAVYLAQIHAAKNNPKWAGTISVTVDFIEALNDDTIHIEFSELEIDQAFVIQSFDIEPDLGAINLTVSSLSKSAYAPVTDHSDTPDIPDYIPDLSVPVPQNVTATFNNRDQVRVEVDDPDEEDLDLEVHIKAPGDDWEKITVTDYVAKSAPVDTNDTYEARARFITLSGLPGDWSDPVTT